jgi:sulfur carrier protein
LKSRRPKQKIEIVAAINILLNGENREVPGEVDLAFLLELFSLPQQRIAIELNNNVIRRAAWPETVVHDRDKIEVVHFVGGG